MKFDVEVFRYIEKDAWRVLVSVEMGMKNHELVPVELINAISGLKHGGAFKFIRDLLKHKLVHHNPLGPAGLDIIARALELNKAVNISGLETCVNVFAMGNGLDANQIHIVDAIVRGTLSYHACDCSGGMSSMRLFGVHCVIVKVNKTKSRSM